MPSVIPKDTVPSGEPLSARVPLLLSDLPDPRPRNPGPSALTMPRTEHTLTPSAESKGRQCEGVGSRPIETHAGTNGPGLLHTLRGHKGNVYGCALSADGRLALSASRDNTCILWTTTSSRGVGSISACRSALSRDLGSRLEMLRGEIGRALFGFDFFRLLD